MLSLFPPRPRPPRPATSTAVLRHRLVLLSLGPADPGERGSCPLGRDAAPASALLHDESGQKEEEEEARRRQRRRRRRESSKSSKRAAARPQTLGRDAQKAHPPRQRRPRRAARQVGRRFREGNGAGRLRGWVDSGDARREEQEEKVLRGPVRVRRDRLWRRGPGGSGGGRSSQGQAPRRGLLQVPLPRREEGRAGRAAGEV